MVVGTQRCAREISDNCVVYGLRMVVAGDACMPDLVLALAMVSRGSGGSSGCVPWSGENAARPSTYTLNSGSQLQQKVNEITKSA